MATAGVYSDETESFVTCTICLCEFNSDTRKPKFLPCSHTICLACLKELHKEFAVVCPLCRKTVCLQDDVSNLPNNPYALHMLKLTEKVPETSSKHELLCKPLWCLTCNVVAKSGCTAHSTIDISATTIRNFESFLKLRDDIKQMKDEGLTKLALAIEKRKEVQSYLAQVSLSLKMITREVEEMEEKNNLFLVQMISQLEGSSPHLRPAVPNQVENPLLAELITLVEDSKPDDSLEILKTKMAKSNSSIESSLAAATALSLEIENQRKSKISVHIRDSTNSRLPGWALLEQGFNTYWPDDVSLTPTRRDFLLLSHIVFSIQKRGWHVKPNSSSSETTNGVIKRAKSVTHLNLNCIVQKEDDSNTTTSANTKSSTTNLLAEDPIASLISNPIKSVATSKESFDINKSIFLLTVRRHGASKGTVHIKLSGSDSSFIRQLGKMCYRSPQEISNMVEKTISSVFSIVPVYENLSTFSYKEVEKLPLARRNKDVGISLWKNEKSGGNGWSLVFPLQFFDLKKYEEHTKTIQPVYLIGEVTKGIEIIDIISWTTKHQRTGYKFTLEAQ